MDFKVASFKGGATAMVRNIYKSNVKTVCWA
jgi:hypothetical protein